MKKTYVFVNQVHFGGLKFSMTKGSKFDLIEEKSEKYVMVNDEKIESIREFELCIKNGFAIPYVKGETEIDDTVRTMPRKKDNKKKMRVEKSDEDAMPETIDISYTKNENIKKEKEKRIKANQSDTVEENEVKTIRGMKILKSNAKNIGGTEEVGDNISSLINGEDAKVVAFIGEKKTAKKTSSKKSKSKEMSAEVKARLEARKKQAKQNHEKTLKENK